MWYSEFPLKRAIKITMKILLAMALLTSSLSANALDYEQLNSQQLLLPLNVTPPITGTIYQQRQQEIQLQREANSIAREQLDIERDRQHDDDFRRAGIKGY
jgi:hypothetical protein